jgi:hypothetical protein
MKHATGATFDRQATVDIELLDMARESCAMAALALSNGMDGLAENALYDAEAALRLRSVDENPPLPPPDA